jgi:hypothetical protein
MGFSGSEARHFALVDIEAHDGTPNIYGEHASVSAT